MTRHCIHRLRLVVLLSLFSLWSGCGGGSDDWAVINNDQDAPQRGGVHPEVVNRNHTGARFAIVKIHISWC